MKRKRPSLLSLTTTKKKNIPNRYRHIDTANGYRNEAGVQRALKTALSNGTLASREDVFLTTKVWPGAPIWKQPALSFEEVVDAGQKSIDKLSPSCNGYVDLYLLHAPLAGSREKRLGQWRGLLELKKQGLARSIGVSNYGVKHLEEIVESGLELPAANQLELHPLSQKRELLAYMKKLKIAVVAYSSLAPLGSWRADYAKPVGSRPSGGGGESGDDPLPGVAEIEALARRLEVSGARLLLRYAVQKGWAVLPKSTHEKRIAENFRLGEFEIADEDMAVLDGLPQSHPMAFGSVDAPFDPTECD